MAETVPLFPQSPTDPVTPGAKARHWQFEQDFHVYEALCRKSENGSCATNINEIRHALIVAGRGKRTAASIRKSVKRLEQMRMIGRRPHTKRGQRLGDIYILKPEDDWR